MIVIDAIDECEGNMDIGLIVRLLPQLQKCASLYLQVFLTSRPKLSVRVGFCSIANDERQDLGLHDIPLPIIGRDISSFPRHRLSDSKDAKSGPGLA